MLTSTRRTKTEMLKGTDAIKARKVANNTLEYHRENGERVIRLHLTDILTFKSNGNIVFDTGGWKTPTTKNRLNDYQHKICIYQDRSIWYCHPANDPNPWENKKKHSLFYDGMEVDSNGRILKPLADDPKSKKLLKLIREYCRELNDLDTFPAKMEGDCMLCQFRVSQGPDTGQALGDATGDQDH
ncbi:MAG: hypothetical protein GY757_53610, partial [bacterium]|nr:hypothetical protein [bacterium]